MLWPVFPVIEQPVASPVGNFLQSIAKECNVALKIFRTPAIAQEVTAVPEVIQDVPPVSKFDSLEYIKGPNGVWVLTPKKWATPPHTEPKPYTIFDALEEFATHHGTLMLVHVESGQSFRVLDFDRATKKTTLKNSLNQMLYPHLLPREGKLYRPVWR
jgi:hypothetical protein